MEKQKKLGLSFTTREEYKRLKLSCDYNGYSEDEVRVVYLSNENLNDIIGDVSQAGIHSISFKIKSTPSIVSKNIRVFQKIYVPTQEEIDSITGNHEKKLRAEEIWEFYEEWFKGCFREKWRYF